MAGILQIIQALAEKDSLEELNLADNAYMDKQLGIKYAKPTNEVQNSYSQTTPYLKHLLIHVFPRNLMVMCS
ncbi:hypothetical protein CRYUN_Cryun22dG0057600 [Craigia yunnanensis]